MASRHFAVVWSDGRHPLEERDSAEARMSFRAVGATLRNGESWPEDPPWPRALSVQKRQALACDLLERALRMAGEEAWIGHVAIVRRWLRGEADRAALDEAASRAMDHVPYRGAYPRTIDEPTSKTLPAWACASLATGSFEDAWTDADRIAAHATCRFAWQAVLDEYARGRAQDGLDAGRIAWHAAARLPGVRGIPAHPEADAARVRALGSPEDDWAAALEERVEDAERAWRRHWLASALEKI